MSTVEFAAEGEIAVVTIDRPEVRNAIDRNTAAALADAFRRFDRDASLSVAILTGSNRMFCAGADLKAGATGHGTYVREDGDGPLGCTRMLLGKPVIAAVEGYAVAGGLELALWCDMRVAARDATFGVYCRRFGVPLADGGTIRLPRLIGMSHAMDMILTGRGVSGEEAFRMGLANRLAEPGNTLATARELAKQIAGFPQHCLRGDRMSAYEAWGMPLDDALRNEYRYGIETIKSGESLAGAQRFASGVGKHGKF
ncbi:MAG TPA: crotonase/enoyl-CoA hydratase family protein [Candidatus Binataceae bacterium]|nr:crotonase/enoyl-CoA hydratase family protein [Candidatus Binataceae bacterium]